MRYHSTRTSSSLGRGALDSVQKLCFQCSLAQRGQPQGFLPLRCHGTRALGQAAVPSQRHSPSHAPSQEAHSKAFRPRVLKFNLIFSIHVRGWEKAAESESRGEVPPGRCLWSQLYQRESYFSASGHCDLQHGAGLALGSHSVFHERFLSHRPKSSSFVLAVGDQGTFILEGRACSCLTKVFTSATGRDVQLALGGDPHSGSAPHICLALIPCTATRRKCQPNSIWTPGTADTSASSSRPAEKKVASCPGDGQSFLPAPISGP